MGEMPIILADHGPALKGHKGVDESVQGRLVRDSRHRKTFKLPVLERPGTAVASKRWVSVKIPVREASTECWRF